MTVLFTAAPRPGTFAYTQSPDTAHFGFHLSIRSVEHAIETSTSRPWDWEPRRATWREREQAKFDEAIYTPPPWYNETFWIEHHAIHKDHFLHISLDDPTQVAYIENEQKGEQDRQTRLRPGRYLKKFFADVLTDKQVAFYAEWFAIGSKPVENRGVIKFATTPEEIRRVYSNGPQSCMKHGNSGVEIYGYGDLAIAYVEDPNRPAGHTIVSRALCWPAQKTFGRVYPTPGENWRHDKWKDEAEAEQVRLDLFQRLRQMGYKYTDEGGSFEGAYLSYIVNGSGYLIAPYLDGPWKVVIEDDHLRMVHSQSEEGLTSSSHTLCDTDGTGPYVGGPATPGWEDLYGGSDYEDEEEEEDTWTCDHCGDGYGDDSEQYTYYGGWSPTPGPHSELTICSYCDDQNGFYCEATDVNYINSDDMVYIYDKHGGSRSVHKNWAEENGFQSDQSEEWFAADCAIKVHTEFGVETWSINELPNNGFLCTWDNTYHALDLASERWPGFPKAYDNRTIRHFNRRKHAPQ